MADRLDKLDLYKQIAGEIRRDILNGVYKPGDRLPSIRVLTEKWNCTLGTVHHAYRELAQQGLVVSRTGRGTHVTSNVNFDQTPISHEWRREILVHRAESFLLESVLSGYKIEEIEESINLARRRMLSI